MADKPETEPAVDAAGQIFITLEGERYFLRPSHKAIRTIEAKLGRSLQELTVQASQAALREEEVAIIVIEMMRAYIAANPDDDNAVTYRNAKADRIAELIFEYGIPKVMGRLVVLLGGALSGGYTAAGELKPAA